MITNRGEEVSKDSTVKGLNQNRVQEKFKKLWELEKKMGGKTYRSSETNSGNRNTKTG